MPSLEQKAGYDQHTTHIQTRMPTPRGKIINVLWGLKKSGKANDTIKNIRKCLIVLAKHTDLENPKSVRTFVATYDHKVRTVLPRMHA